MLRVTVAAVCMALTPHIACGEAAIPDDRLTPGVVASTDDAEVCAPGYARSQRLYENDREAFWRVVEAVLASYHIPFAERHGYEIDHRVPLCLGGSNDARNLWPQPLLDAREKDEIERAACIAVCRDHTLTLDQAQRLFLAPTDWRKARIIGSGRQRDRAFR
jgi:hypothetical protein